MCIIVKSIAYLNLGLRAFRAPATVIIRTDQEFESSFLCVKEAARNSVGFDLCSVAPTLARCN